MNLFDDIVLFDEGRKRYQEFDLPDAGLQLWEQFYSKPDSDRYYQELLRNSPWEQRRRPMYDKVVLDPRLTAYYGGEKGHAWTETLLEIKAHVEKQAGVLFNRVLLNYYRDGNDSVAWHSDTLPSDGVHHAIASVTFGDTRMFKVRHKRYANDKSLHAEIPLTHGSLLLMGAQMQNFYEHHVPKTKKQVGPRINLTFRIADFSKKISYAPHETIYK